MCMHILSTIALHWPQRFFAYEFSKLELEHLKREQKDTIPNMYSMEQYEEDLQQFMSSILSSQKHITTLINKDILSIARHIDVLSEKDQQIAFGFPFNMFLRRDFCVPSKDKPYLFERKNPIVFWNIMKVKSILGEDTIPYQIVVLFTIFCPLNSSIQISIYHLL